MLTVVHGHPSTAQSEPGKTLKDEGRSIIAFLRTDTSEGSAQVTFAMIFSVCECVVCVYIYGIFMCFGVACPIFFVNIKVRNYWEGQILIVDIIY